MGVISGTTAAIIGAVAIGATAGGIAIGSAMSGSRRSDSPQAPKMDVGTGALSEGEAQSAAKKRMFRAGVISTSVQGLGSGETLGTTKLR